jgi:anti-sigma B factor antagonist
VHCIDAWVAESDVLRVQTDIGDATVRVRLAGELDLSSARDLRHAVRDAVQRAGRRHTTVELDLSALTFCDAAGVAAFIALSRECEGAGHGVELRHPRGAVRRVFDIVRLAETVTVRDD